MATLNGNTVDIITNTAFSAKGRFITTSGIDGTPPTVVTYFMAAFDTLNNRYFWTNQDATFTGAPTPAGSYVSNTLIIEGRVEVSG